MKIVIKNKTRTVKVVHTEWEDKQNAIKTKSPAVLRKLSKHKSDFVRLAVIFNPTVKSKPEILVDIVRRDPVISIRDAAIAMLEKIRR